MITDEVVAILILAVVLLAFAIFLLVYGIYTALTDKDKFFFGAMFALFLFLSGLSVIVFNEAHKEYQNAIPQNQVKILRQKISDAEKELQKYLIDHPELEEKTNAEN